VVDATKRELYAFKLEAKHWSQSDNRLLAPSASEGSARHMSTTHSFRNLRMHLYMYMFILVCDLTEVFFIPWKRRFYPECYLFIRPAFRCLVIQPAFRCLTYLDLA